MFSMGGVGLFVVVGSFCEKEIRMPVKSRARRNIGKTSAVKYRSSSFVSQATETASMTTLKAKREVRNGDFKFSNQISPISFVSFRREVGVLMLPPRRMAPSRWFVSFMQMLSLAKPILQK